MADVGITSTELRDAWDVLSLDERIEAFRFLDHGEVDDFFRGLSAPDQAGLLLAMPLDERPVWLRLLTSDALADVVQSISDAGRESLLDLLDDAKRREVAEALMLAPHAEAEVRPPLPEPAPAEIPPDDPIPPDSTRYQVFRTVGTELLPATSQEKGIWINLVNPTEREIRLAGRSLGIDIGFLRASLDEEERPRIEVEGGVVLIIVDVPVLAGDDSLDLYTTIPVGIVLAKQGVVTVCLRGDTVLQDFASGRVKGFVTQFRTRFVLQLLYRTATRFLQHLRSIEKSTSRIEAELASSMKNKELLQLLKLEKSLVYFSTSLKSNELVLEKLMRLESVRSFPEDKELLEDVIIENKQALEMAHIHTNILSGTMDAFASIISNNLNIVMKVLTSMTIVMAIPTMVASFFGMNVPLPMTGPHGFLVATGLSVTLTAAAIVLLWRRRMF